MNPPPSIKILREDVVSSQHVSPLHRQVQDFLREAIEEHFEDGQSFWTEALLIERLGVSRITVRQALGELTREGLLLRKASLGTSVRKTGVNSIGMVFPQYDSDAFIELLQRVAAVCLDRKLHFELYPTMHHAEVGEVVDKIRRPPQQESLIVLSQNNASDRERYQLLTERGYRVIAIEEYAPDQQVSCVVTDVEMAVRLALEHLRQLGHRHIVFLVNEPPERESVQRKIREFERLLQEHGLDEGRVVLCDCSEPQDSFNRAYRSMPKLWNSGKRPTAIFTASDPGAWAALRWFAQHDVKVPNEVSVIGFENVKPDAFTHPSLTSVGHSFDEMARRAVEMLWQNRIEQVLVPPFLEVRESTGLCPEIGA